MKLNINTILFLLLFSISTLFSQDTTFEKIHFSAGPEDIILDGKNLIVSCSERREENVFSSGIWIYNTETELKQKLKVELLKERHFSPHGISLLKENGKKYLFIVNHTTNKLHEIVCFELKEHSIKEIKSFKNKLIKHPNSVAAVSLNEFYYTNDILFSGSLGQFKDGQYKLISKGLSYANGIFIKEDKIYVSTTMGNKVLKFERKEIKYVKQVICKIKGPDNIRPYKSDKLLIAAHPNVFKFLKHVKDKNKLSPTAIYEIDLSNNSKKLIFKDDGSKISANSTAILSNGYLYIAQVFEDFLLKVKL